MSQPSDQANVLRLYEELGVRPDQGVDRLTERYRQRLRELHPDSGARPRGDGRGSDDGLGWITRSYREALEFERRHGRLPGAGLGGGPPPQPVGRPQPAAARRVVRAARPPRRLWRWLVFAAALALLVGVLAPELMPLFAAG